MTTYGISIVSGRTQFENSLKNLPRAAICCFPWENTPHPYAYAILARSSDAFHVFMECNEKEIRALQTEQNGPIYTDSCLEFYFRPSEKSDLYLNIEVNPKGVIFFSVGSQRQDRFLITSDGPKELNLIAKIQLENSECPGWQICYDLPFNLIKKYVPPFDGTEQAMWGNFYKCGNGLSQPHWGCWSPVDTPKPDFHRPEYFGRFFMI